MIGQRLRTSVAARTLRSVLVRPITLTIVIAVLLGGVGGQLLASAGENNQIVVGNTGGTLSSIIRIEGALIIFGGGNARSDLADLLGRSTLPWKRQVDLLIIPGWDDKQATGALGLLERQDVKQIVILGQPSTATVWTVLYQTAGSRAIPVNVVNGRSIINIGPSVRLELATGDPLSGQSSEFALVTLRNHAVQLTFLDASKDGIQALNAAPFAPQRTHSLILTRSVSGLSTASSLRVYPSGQRAADFDLAISDYQRELRQGEQLTIGLAASQLRFKLDAVQRRGGPQSTATPQTGDSGFRGNLQRLLATDA